MEYFLYGDATLIELMTFSQQLSKDYIWQKQEFNLKCCKPGCFAGSTDFGEAMDDEYFIVFILQEITRQFNVVAQVKDEDGDFLLFDASDDLPEWVTPDIMENRVWIKQGQLYLIPPISDESHLSLNVALKRLGDTEADENIQKSCFSKCLNYHSCSHHYHKARVFLPENIAYLLCKCPRLIAPAVEAVVVRDPTAFQSCHAMQSYPPTNMVKTTVKFTRLLYAQLVCTELHPPKPFAHLPTEIEWELGMKIACGFEMLKKQSFASFIKSLEKRGYFSGNSKGSKEYQHLLNLAETAFKESLQWDPAAVIESLLPFEPLVCDDEPDTEEWLNVEEDDIEIKNDIPDVSDLPQEEQEDLQYVVDQLKTFLNEQSGPEGIQDTVDMQPDDIVSRFMSLMGQADSDDDSENEYRIGSDVEADLIDETLELDKNLIENTLRCLEAQGGMAGPLTTLASSIGLNFIKK